MYFTLYLIAFHVHYFTGKMYNNYYIQYTYSVYTNIFCMRIDQNANINQPEKIKII